MRFLVAWNFGSISNATKLSFKTGSSEGSEKMSLVLHQDDIVIKSNNK